MQYNKKYTNMCQRTGEKEFNEELLYHDNILEKDNVILYFL